MADTRKPEAVLAQHVRAAVAEYVAGGTPAPTRGEVLAVEALERIAAGAVRLRDTRTFARAALDVVADVRAKGGDHANR
jgi:hypothetical protein